MGLAEHRPQVDRLLSSQQLNTLQSKLSSRVVLLTLTASPKPKLRFVGPRLRSAQGYLLTEDLILSSAALLSLAPDEASLSITARCAYSSHGHTVDHQEGVLGKEHRISLQQGWVILKTKKALPCAKPTIKASQLLPYLTSERQDRDESAIRLYRGAKLYAYEPHPKRPSMITIEGKSRPPMDYYWYSSASLHLGTPLFNHRGELITLVGMTDETFLQVHLLPDDAINSMKRSFRGQ